MRRFLFLLLLLSATPAAGQGIVPPATAPTEYRLWDATVLFNNGTTTGGTVLPSTNGFTITHVVFNVSTVSGGGAGNNVLTFTDGTNTCTVTLPCTTSSTLGSYRVATANGAGTGCRYAPGASITSSVTTAGCTTNNPTVRNYGPVGRWR